MCKHQKGVWYMLLVKKNGTIRVQHLKPLDLGCYRCHKLKQVRICELEQGRIFYSLYASQISPFSAKALCSDGQNQREIQLERYLFFGTFIYIDEQAPGKLLSHYQLSKIQAEKRYKSIKKALEAGCLRMYFLICYIPTSRTYISKYS